MQIRSIIFYTLLLVFLSQETTAMTMAKPLAVDEDSLTVDSLPKMHDKVEIDTIINHSSSHFSVYDLEYSFTANYPNKKQLIDNTKGIVGGMLIATGVMMLLPDDMTNWNDDSGKNIFKRWFHNVKKGPVIDEDGFVVNYILHPYSGAVYFMTARSAGYNAWRSLLFVSFVSTFIWEYGLESFAEPPSLQDLLTTPLIGGVMGEGFYLAKREIVARDYRVLNSRLLGKILVFIMDPVTEIMGLVFHTNQYHPDMEKWQVFCPISNLMGQKIFLSFKITF